MIAPARIAAYDVLRAVNGGREDLPAALARARRGLSDERDRALAGEIAAGTLRWLAALDHVISASAGRPVSRLDPEVLDILRLTVFQLLHLDRVPASAAVNDAVSLTRQAAKRSAAPLVNAVLRRVSRERRRLPLPPRPADEKDREAVLDYLSITLSHPRWLARRWLDRHGFDKTERWAAFNNEAAALTLRANPLRTTRDRLRAALEAAGVHSRPGRFAPDALIVSAGNPRATPLAAGGDFLVQEEASQLVPLMVGARPGERVLDACASPGGKTSALAADMRNEGLLVAADVRPRRIRLLHETLRRTGARAHIVQADVSAPLPFRAAFDAVLLDAPCSGLGTIRRDPEIRWRRREEDLPAFAAAQLSMLHQTSAVVRPGGRLVYATCSSEPEENEQVVAQFLSSHRDFTAARPGSLPAAVLPLLTGDGYLQTWPFRDGIEAFFAAILVKRKDLQ